VELRLRLEEGKTYYQRLAVDQRIVQNAMGIEQATEHNLGSDLKMDVLAVDDQGNMRIRDTYTWLQFKQLGPMSSVDYDSAKQSGQVPPGAEGFAALLGQSYTITISPQGKVLDVNGVEALREVVTTKLPPGAEGTPMMNALEPFMSKEGISEMTKGSFAVYPDKAVELGDSWEETMTISLGPVTKVQTKWTFDKRDGDTVIIQSASTMRSDPEAPPVDAGQMKLKFDLSGTEEGTTRVAEATGLILSNVSTQKLSGQIMLATSADAPPMMSIPITLETTATTEMSDQMWKTDNQ